MSLAKPARIIPDPEPETSGGEIDLGSYVRVLWRSRGTIAIGTAIVVGLVLVGSLVLPPQYEASAVFILRQPSLGGDAGPTAVNSTFTVPTFTRLLANRGLAATVIAKFGLSQPPTRLDEAGFLDRLTIEEVPGTPLIRVTLRLTGVKDGAAARDVLNAFADEALALGRRLNEEQTNAARDFLTGESEKAKARFQTAESALLAFKQKAQIDLVKKDTATLLDQRGRIPEIVVEIESERARLAKAEEEIAKQPRMLASKKSIDNSPALMEAARASSGQAAVVGIQMQDEFSNPTYEALERQITASRTRLSALERERHEMVDVMKLNGAEIRQLTDLSAKEIELSRLELEYDVAKAAYRDLTTRVEQARVQSAGRTAELQLIDRAAVQSGSRALAILRNLLIAAVIGLILFSLGAIAAHSLRRTLESR